MATFQWAASGSQGAWTDVAAATNFSAVANNSGVASAAIDNTTTLAERMQVSFVSTAAGIAVVAGGHIAIYVLPLLHDATTYPTNTPANSTATATLPSIVYCLDAIGVQNGTVAPAGMVEVPIPFGTFKIMVVNRLGVALATSTTANTARYRLIYDVTV